jgi:hypothetical protein
LPRRGGVYGLAIDPQDAGIIYALLHQNDKARSGLFKSSDGAASWSELDSLVPFGGILNLWIDPQNPATLYARTNYGRMLPLVKSTDGGLSWSVVTPAIGTSSLLRFQKNES